jgi:DNA-binding NarL/FixJ family response regulator
MTLSVSLVEDDFVIRESFRRLIDRSADVKCISTFESGEAALIGIPSAPPDVLLMDINLPGISGIECVRELKGRCPGIEMLMLTVYSDHDRIFEALRAGASGYLLKRAAPSALLEAIQQVHAGGSPISPEIARQVVHFFRERPSTDSDDHTGCGDGISSREREILSLLAQGKAYKQIAGQLEISVDTVRSHIRRIYHKLHVHSRTEAVVKFLGKGRAN